MSAEPEIPKVEVPKLEESVTEDTPAPTTDDQNNQTPQVIDVEKLQHEFQESAKRYLVEQTAQVIVPSFAKWFDLSKIHDIEKNRCQISLLKMAPVINHHRITSTFEILLSILLD